MQGTSLADSHRAAHSEAYREREGGGIQKMSADQLQQYVNKSADELRATLKGGRTRDTTLCITVLQKKGAGPESRIVLLTSSAESYESKLHITGGGKLAEIGPYLKARGKDETGKPIYFVQHRDGTETRYDHHTRTEHHAEQRALNYANTNGYDILAMAPTSGCCQGCRDALGTELAKVPNNRRSQEAFQQYHQEQRKRNQ